MLQRYKWVKDAPRLNELKGGVFTAKGKNKASVRQTKDDLRPYAKAYLEDYSKRRKISPVKRLSAEDLELLSTAVVFDGVIATDEWPLGVVIEDLQEDPDYKILKLTSVHILHLFETNGQITKDERLKAVETWQFLKEKLHRDWIRDYEKLFNEHPIIL